MTAKAADLPEPPLPTDLDLSSLEYMPLVIMKLRRSKAWLKAKRRPELGFYMMNLWMVAWTEKPAASLDDDDDVLADAAMCDPCRWEEVRELAMHGFYKCSNGRLYHPFLVEQAEKALEKRLKWREKKKGQRTESPVCPPDVPGDTEGTDVGINENNSNVPGDNSNVPRDIGGTLVNFAGDKPLRDGTGRESKEREESTAAAPESETAPTVTQADADAGRTDADVMEEARAIARAFGNALDAVYGKSAMRTQNVTDEMHVARSWVLDVGMTAPMAGAIFEGEMRAGVERKKHPIQSMRYLDKRIREAHAKNAAGADERMRDASLTEVILVGPQRSAESAQWIMRVRKFKESGFWLAQFGEPPTDPNNLIPVDVLAEVYGQEWREILRGPQAGREQAA